MVRTPKPRASLLASHFSKKAGRVGETTPKINPRDLAQRGRQAGTRSARCEGNMGTDLEPEGGQRRPWTSFGATPGSSSGDPHQLLRNPGTENRSLTCQIPQPLGSVWGSASH